MNTRAHLKYSDNSQQLGDMKCKREEGELYIQRLNIDNLSNEITTIQFQKRNKIVISKTYSNNEKRALKLQKHNNKPITLGLVNSIKQGPDNKLYNVLEDLSAYQQVSQEMGSQLKFIKCNCSKSQCQKMYCECYANGTACSNLCQCQGCQNTNTDKSQVVIQQIKCGCQKSRCTKNYCECYTHNQKCSDQCRCISCENFEEPQPVKMVSQLDENSQSRYKSFSFVKPQHYLLRQKDSMNFSNNSFGFSRLDMEYILN